MSKKTKLDEVLVFLQKEYNLEPADVLQLIKSKEKEQKEQQSCYIPVSLFSAVPLSSLEAMTIYLRETKKLKFSVMAKILGRNQISLSTSYRNARKKYTRTLNIPESKWHIPAIIFQNRQLSVLESIVLYMKKEYRMHNTTIATVLGKDPRTIWTVLQRIKNKEVKL